MSAIRGVAVRRLLACEFSRCARRASTISSSPKGWPECVARRRSFNRSSATGNLSLISASHRRGSLPGLNRILWFGLDRDQYSLRSSECLVKRSRQHLTRCPGSSRTMREVVRTTTDSPTTPRGESGRSGTHPQGNKEPPRLIPHNQRAGPRFTTGDRR